MSSITLTQLPWLDRIRQTATERFREQGLPTTKLEAWRFTNIEPIKRVDFQPAVSASPLPDSLRHWLDSIPFPRLVFVDGYLYQSGSSPSGRRWREAPDEGPHPPLGRPLPGGEGLAWALTDSPTAELLEAHLGRHADVSHHAFAAWNTAAFSDGAFINIPANQIVSDPIYLVFISTAGSVPRVSFPRNLIIVGEGASVSFVEVFLSVTDGVHLTNAVTEIAAGPGAAIDYYKLAHEARGSYHFATVAASLGPDANLTAHSFSLGSALIRNELRIALDGEGGQCALNGLFLADGDRLVDNETEIDHRKPHTTSRELYKGIIGGRGQGVFNGAIVVRKDAQQTNAVQHNKNLLLSEDARINTKPQLEIRADDVRCAHGASIGQIDQESLFYLRTRGLDESTARRVLIRGFAAEILDGIRVPTVRQQCEGLLDEWFERQLEAA